MPYFGDQDIKTAEMVSVKVNVPLNSILDMSTKDAWLFTRGESGKRVKKQPRRLVICPPFTGCPVKGVHITKGGSFIKVLQRYCY